MTPPQIRPRTTQLLTWAFVLWTVCAVAAIPAVAQAQDATVDKLRVLFIGNSQTFRNQVYSIVERMSIASNMEKPVEAMRITRGGWTFERHTESRDEDAPLQVIGRGGWDYVVLQEHGRLAAESGGASLPFAGRLVRAVREAGATPLFYMTWAYRDQPEAQARISQTYFQLGSRLEVQVAPAGEAFRLARKTATDIELLAADGVHGSLEGSYLAACVIFAKLYNRSPVGIHSWCRKVEKKSSISIQSMPAVCRKLLGKRCRATSSLTAEKKHSLHRLLCSHTAKRYETSKPLLFSKRNRFMKPVDGQRSARRASADSDVTTLLRNLEPDADTVHQVIRTALSFCNAGNSTRSLELGDRSPSLGASDTRDPGSGLNKPLAARGESQIVARARDFSSDQGAKSQAYWSISRIWQRRAGGKDPLSTRSDFCHGLLGTRMIIGQPETAAASLSCRNRGVRQQRITTIHALPLTEEQFTDFYRIRKDASTMDKKTLEWFQRRRDSGRQSLVIPGFAMAPDLTTGRAV